MNNNIFEDFMKIIKKKLQNRRWRQAVTFLACAVVFSTTYALILPAITMSAKHPSLAAEELEALSGETLSVRVEVGAEEEDRLILLSAESVGADLAEKYPINKEGIALITDDEGRELELHRVSRKDNKNITDYWFELPAGESTAFTLELEDKFDPERYGEAMALARSITAGEADKETATASDAERKEAGTALNTGAVGTASPSDAEQPAAETLTQTRPVKKTASAATASNATASNADVFEANEIASGEEQELILTEVNDDGFLEILDGAVVNDLYEDEEEEEDEEEKIAAVLKLSAGSGSSLEEAIVDVNRNADKRENARLTFVWKVDLAELPDMLWTGDGVRISVRYGEDAWIPEDALLKAQEIREDEDGEDDYKDILLRAEEAVDRTDAAAESAAETAGGIFRDIVRARFFELEIISADGNRVLPEAPVEVKIHFDEPFAVAEKNSQETVILTEEDAAVIRAERDSDEAGIRELSFEYGGSAVIGIAELASRESRTLSAEGENYSVTLRYGAEAGLPQDAVLTVEEIPVGSKEYENLKKNAAENLGESGTPAPVTFARFFRLKVLSGETELDPAEAAEVEIRYPEAATQRIVNLNTVIFADGLAEHVKTEALTENGTVSGNESDDTEENEGGSTGDSGDSESRKLCGISFQAQQPFLMGVVEAPKQQDLGKLKAKYGNYVIQLRYDDESRIPGNTVLRIAEPALSEEDEDRIFNAYYESGRNSYIRRLGKLTVVTVEPECGENVEIAQENKAYISVSSTFEAGDGEDFFAAYLKKDGVVLLDAGGSSAVSSKKAAGDQVTAEIGSTNDGFLVLMKVYITNNDDEISEASVGLKEEDREYIDEEISEAAHEAISFGDEIPGMDLEAEETGKTEENEEAIQEEGTVQEEADMETEMEDGTEEQ